ncbi:hypothetical protein [Paenibacillus elgii]|uniref:hypothetical protein n=1 Tax=Paenibacillus elgii TaxID=189691 RepID=UPI0002F2F74A|nr:hypothetical protein [Paenibacillus elgii]
MSEYVNSKTKIFLRHIKCEKIIDILPSSFLMGNRCRFCMGGVKNRDTKSFKEEVKQLTNDEYVILGEYVNAKTKVPIMHKKCGYSYEVTPDTFLSGCRCPKCSGKMRKTHNEFLKEIEEICDSEYTVISTYFNYSTKVSLVHNICNHEYMVTPADFISGGKRCPKCFRNDKKTTKIFQQELSSKYGDEYTVLGEYTGANNKIKVFHKKCNKPYYPTPSNLLRGISRCSTCQDSKGEEKVSNFLISHKINFTPQYSFKDCKRIFVLRFDFAVFDNDNNLLFLIEYDGVQHFEPTFGIRAFKNTLSSDEIKNKYCLSKSIELIRIPYWEFDNIENILEDKIKNNKLTYSDRR